MPNMDYSLIHRTPDGTGKVLVTTPGSPDKGSYVLEADMKIYTNQGMVAIADIVDDLVTADDSKPLSANQGVVLKQLIDAVSGGITPKGDILSSNLPPADDTNKGWQYYCTDINQWATSDGTQWIMTSNSIIVQTPDATDTGHALSNAVVTQCCNEVKGKLNQHESRLENLEQKAGDYTTVQYRGTDAVPTGKAKYGLVKEIVGKTRAWNQLADIATGSAVGEWNEYNYTTSVTADTANDKIIVKSRGSLGRDAMCRIATIGISHAFLFSATLKNNYTDRAIKANIYKIASSSGIVGDYTISANSQIDVSIVVNSGLSDSITKLGVLFADQSGLGADTTVSCDIIKPIIRDLTTIFPEGVPSTIAECVQKCPDLLKYDAYNAGSLVDTEVSGVESRDTSDNVLATLSLSETVTLRSAGSVSEVLTLETGKKTRPIGSVDLGTLDWEDSGYGNNTVYAHLTGIKTNMSNVLCQRYVVGPCVSTSSGVTQDKCLYTFKTYGGIGIRDTSYDFTNPEKVAELKASLLGVTLYYELATPLSDEQVCDPITDNFIEVQGGGTIDTIQDQTPVIDNCLDVGYLTL